MHRIFKPISIEFKIFALRLLIGSTIMMIPIFGLNGCNDTPVDNTLHSGASIPSPHTGHLVSCDRTDIYNSSNYQNACYKLGSKYYCLSLTGGLHLVECEANMFGYIDLSAGQCCITWQQSGEQDRSYAIIVGNYDNVTLVEN